MAQAPAESGLGVPMAWRHFLELPDDLRAEYTDGKVLVNPPPSFAHQKACLSLRDLLVAQLGSRAVVAVAVGWRLSAHTERLRIPDLMVLPAEPAGPMVTEPPPVVVEVLSSNRGEDLVRKSTEYLEAGVGQYWVVDPRDRVLDVYARSDSGWDHLAQLTDTDPAATIATPFGPVALVLAEILGSN